MDIFTWVAGNTISNVAVGSGTLVELMKDVIHKEENRHILQAEHGDPSTRYQYHLPRSTESAHADRQGLVGRAAKFPCWKSLLHRSEARQWCLDCLAVNPVRLSKQLREWKVSFDNLFQSLSKHFSTIVSTQHIVKSAPQRELLQDVPAFGFVGSCIGVA